MRRDFHKHPETGFVETRTSGVIADELKRLELQVQTGIATTGVVGVLDVHGASKSVAFRADMDALPITEENELEFKSQNEGVSMPVDMMRTWRCSLARSNSWCS